MKNTKELVEKCTDCGACVKNCLFLRENCESPKEIAEETLKNPFGNIERTYSCNMCALCEKVCPEKLSPAGMFREERRVAFKEVEHETDGELYEFMSKRFTPLRGHQYFSTSDIFTATIKGGAREIKRIFFPGCSLPAYSPELVLKTWEYLLEHMPDTALMLNCCGKPTYELGDLKKFDSMLERLDAEIAATGADELIVACPECHYVFTHLHKKIRVISLYETIVRNGVPELKSKGMPKAGGKITVHDSCNARHNADIQDAVREIATAAGYELFEMKHKRKVTMCCGGGGCAPFGKKETAQGTTKQRVGEAKGNTIVSYCGFCRERFSEYGPSLHLLDLLFAEDVNEKSVNKTSPSWKNWVRRGFLKLRAPHKK